MADTSAKPVAEIKDGKLIHSRVTDKIESKIEKGALTTVNAIIVHQTGSSSANATFESYKDGGNGAHFLIGKDGTIYQTARANQKCWHVGNIRSRCNELKTCSADELKEINAILFKKGEAYSVRVKRLSEHEKGKDYPKRYPSNDDSLGIEIVGLFDAKAAKYETVNKAQNDSLAWLIDTLQSALGLKDDDVYRHPQVSYKQETEAKTAKW